MSGEDEYVYKDVIMHGHLLWCACVVVLFRGRYDSCNCLLVRRVFFGWLLWLCCVLVGKARDCEYKLTTRISERMCAYAACVCVRVWMWMG